MAFPSSLIYLQSQQYQTSEETNSFAPSTCSPPIKEVITVNHIYLYEHGCITLNVGKLLANS